MVVPCVAVRRLAPEGSCVEDRNGAGIVGRRTCQRLRHPVFDRAMATNRPHRTMRRAARDTYAARVTSPNILIVMTDEERYPPPYETETVTAFRRNQLPAREPLRTDGGEFHRHYAGSPACLPCSTTLFTGQYPSLHGASQ